MGRFQWHLDRISRTGYEAFIFWYPAVQGLAGSIEPRDRCSLIILSAYYGVEQKSVFQSFSLYDLARDPERKAREDPAPFSERLQSFAKDRLIAPSS